MQETYCAVITVKAVNGKPLARWVAGYIHHVKADGTAAIDDRSAPFYRLRFLTRRSAVSFINRHGLCEVRTKRDGKLTPPQIARVATLIK